MIRSLTPCLLLLPLACMTAAGPSEFATLAEGLTSRSQEAGIKVAYRMFSAPDFPEICAQSERLARLAGSAVPVTLSVGKWYSLDRLVVRALDASHRQLPPLPITLEVDKDGRALLDLRSRHMQAEARVLPVREGSFRFRARAICPGASAEVTIKARIRKSR